jgi:HEAT repeat protein
VKNGDEPFYHRYRPLTGWDDPGHVAGTAAQSLGLLGPVALDAVPYLTQLFVSSHGDVRIAVSEAIAAIDPQGENSVPLLIELLNHENPDVRMTAAHTLGLIGPYAFEALQPLEEMLEDPVEPVMEVRGEIRTAIDKIGSSSPVTH